MFRGLRLPKPASKPRGRIGRRLAVALVPVVTLVLLLMGLVTYLQSRAVLAREAAAQLEGAASAQGLRIQEWVEARESWLKVRGVERLELIQALEAYTSAESAAERQAAVERLREELAGVRSRENETVFSEVLLVDASDGRVVASTQRQHEGSSLPLDLVQEEMVGPGQTVHTLTRFDDPVLAPGMLAFVTASPMTVGTAHQQAFLLLGVSRGLRLAALLDELQVFAEQRGVFRTEQGATYLIHPPDLVVRMQRYEPVPVTEYRPGLLVMELAPSQGSGSELYRGLSDEPVFGGFQWLPEWEIGIVSEIPEDQVFAQLDQILPVLLAIVLGAALLTSVAVVWVTNRALQPLGTLAEFADRVAQGEWFYRIPYERQDEIGVVAAALNRMAQELSGLYRSLEVQVEARTRQIQTAAEVARAVTSVPDLDELLRRAVDLIRERFGYYHVSIFLLDEERRYAVLREATGEVGEALKARGHRLAVGSNSVIGWVTANNQPRVASDVSEDPIHLRNELLPETRSEAAVPLQVAGEVLGALDVQSTEPDAFQPEDIEVLQTLADQLSAAIQNARLAQVSVEAARRARLLSEVTGRLSGMLDVERALRTAASTLHRSLGLVEVTIDLTPGRGNSRRDGAEEGQGRRG